jgi:hypothetical protein
MFMRVRRLQCFDVDGRANDLLFRRGLRIIMPVKSIMNMPGAEGARIEGMGNSPAAGAQQAAYVVGAVRR